MNRFWRIWLVGLLLSQMAVAQKENCGAHLYELSGAELADAVFGDDEGELDPKYALARIAETLRETPHAFRAALLEDLMHSIEERAWGWTFVQRRYRGGVLYIGPYAHMRWLTADGNLYKARLPEGYWLAAKEDDAREPRVSILDRLPWQLVQ